MGVPKYAFIVERVYRVAPGKLNRESKNLETLPACVTIRDAWLKHPLTSSVRIMAVLDECTKQGG